MDKKIQDIALLADGSERRVDPALIVAGHGIPAEQGIDTPQNFQRLAYLARMGLIDGSEMAYEPDANPDKKDREKEDLLGDPPSLSEMALASSLENAKAVTEVFEDKNGLTHTLTHDDGRGYDDLTITNKNGDRVGGMCMAPGARTSFARESDEITEQAEHSPRSMVSSSPTNPSFNDHVRGWNNFSVLDRHNDVKPVFMMTTRERNAASFATLSGQEPSLRNAFSDFTVPHKPAPKLDVIDAPGMRPLDLGIAEDPNAMPLTSGMNKPATNDSVFRLAM